MPKRNNKGRGDNRLQKAATVRKATPIDSMDADSRQLASALHKKQLTAKQVVTEAAASTKEVAHRLMFSLAQVQFKKLADYEKVLSDCSKYLTAPECWQFFADHEEEAVRYGVHSDLRAMTVIAARRFCGEPVDRIPLRDKLGVAGDDVF